MSNSTLTFGALKSEVRALAWPEGEAVNLRSAHNKSFADACTDLQRNVPCYKRGVVSVYPFCATYFQTGLTVIEGVAGIIRSLGTYVKRNETTGVVDADGVMDWSSRRLYTEVLYEKLAPYASRKWDSVANVFPYIPCTSGCAGGFYGYLGNCCARFPEPTDDDYVGFPELPLGFHYNQSSTDNPCGRAQEGVWAKYRGNIYIAPWILSSEIIIINWDGSKASWGDDDLLPIPDVDENTFKSAVEWFVRAEHEKRFGDYKLGVANEMEYAKRRQLLMLDCRRRTLQRGIEGSHAHSASTLEAQSTGVVT